MLLLLLFVLSCLCTALAGSPLQIPEVHLSLVFRAWLDDEHASLRWSVFGGAR
jgi:hypothetical protein